MTGVQTCALPICERYVSEVVSDAASAADTVDAQFVVPANILEALTVVSATRRANSATFNAGTYNYGPFNSAGGVLATTAQSTLVDSSYGYLTYTKAQIEALTASDAPAATAVFAPAQTEAAAATATPAATTTFAPAITEAGLAVASQTSALSRRKAFNSAPFNTVRF